jgi:hypothetical protein
VIGQEDSEEEESNPITYSATYDDEDDDDDVECGRGSLDKSMDISELRLIMDDNVFNDVDAQTSDNAAAASHTTPRRLKALTPTSLVQSQITAPAVPQVPAAQYESLSKVQSDYWHKLAVPLSPHSARQSLTRSETGNS